MQVIQLLPQERIQERIEEGIIDVLSSACGGGNDRGREAGTKFPAAVGGDLVAISCGSSSPTDKLAKETTHDLEINFNKIAPFGKEDTSKASQVHAAKTQDTSVDAAENAEVFEIKREVFRALARLRAATKKEIDSGKEVLPPSCVVAESPPSCAARVTGERRWSLKQRPRSLSYISGKCTKISPNGADASAVVHPSLQGGGQNRLSFDKIGSSDATKCSRP